MRSNSAELSRRGFVAGLAAAGALGLSAARGRGAEPMLDDPYAAVDWDAVECLHSMSHQHEGKTTASLDQFYQMGYRHLAFSNYYPSAPVGLPAAWAAAHPDALPCGNAEQHSFLDSGTHCNSLGSQTSTGGGWYASLPKASPYEHVFEGLKTYDADDRPWEGVHRLDIRLAGVTGAKPAASLTLSGGLACNTRGELDGDGHVADLPWDERRGTIVFRSTAPELKVHLTFDPATTKVAQFRLMQGSYRPVRDVFKACLDGELIDGRLVGGLEFADGGGITINHPTIAQPEHYLSLLDWDPRVLGIEVYNHNTTGFGSTAGFYDSSPGPHQHFYQLWDRILRTGRRCLGFFVKDHMSCGAGRNVLLVPPAAGRSQQDRRHDALVAYRRGAFFGSLGASATTAQGELVPPHDHTNFRFTRHQLVGHELHVEVTGQDAGRRPLVQLRFVADGQLVQVTDGPRASYQIPQRDGRPAIGYVRVEAFAYPARVQGRALTPVEFAKLSPAAVQQLHEVTVDESCFYRGGGKPGGAPVGVVDSLFGQPVRFST